MRTSTLVAVLLWVVSGSLMIFDLYMGGREAQIGRTGVVLGIGAGTATVWTLMDCYSERIMARIKSEEAEERLRIYKEGA